MRRIGRAVPVLLALATGLVAGCGGGDDGPTVLTVVTPAASATAGAAPAPAPTGTGSGPGSAGTGGSGPGPAGTDGSGPVPTGVPAPAPAGPLAAYQGMATDWQQARGIFFTAVSDGRRRTVAQQRALAAPYLAAQRAFAARLAGTGWPVGAQRAVRALVAVNREQQANIAGMARAGSSADFTGWLGRYGLVTKAENAAVDAVAVALR